MRFQVNAYKLLTQWYVPPDKIKICFLFHLTCAWDVANLWDRCSTFEGSVLGSWLSGLGSVISSTKSQVNCYIKLSPEYCLLHISDLPLRKYKCSLVRHLLNAARSLIPYYWKTTYIPMVKDWLYEVNTLYDMEESIAIAADITTSFHKTWGDWYSFRYSTDYELIASYSSLKYHQDSPRW